MNSLKTNIYNLLLKGSVTFFLFILFCFHGFSQIHPVTITAHLNPPYSVFLFDYYEDGSNLLNANVTFNDLNEVDRDVFFKVRIESSDIAIYSKPEYISPEPFNLLSGVLYEFSGEDFENCLNYNNLIFSGIDQNEFIQSGGRLPSGFYMFYLEVYDFKSGKKLSNTAQFSAQIRLNSPPDIILPANTSVVPVSENQNVSIQWQPVIIYGSTNPEDTEYSISVYKIFDSCVDPDNAIINKQAEKIFESEYISDLTFLYNLNHPFLEVGKRYAIRLHARDIYDRNFFENNGYSEQQWFYYGYPEDGHITLEMPEDEKNFSIQDLPLFKWGPSDNTIPGQQVYYKFKIVKTDSLAPEEAILVNDPYFEKTTITRSGTLGAQVSLPSFLDRQDQYAWQVKAYTNDQEIGESDVYVCYGPPLLEMFWAEHHKIYVTKTTTSDYNHLSGKGRIKISDSDEMVDISFTDIKVENIGEWVLRDGVIFYKLENAPPIPLTPNNTVTGTAYLVGDSLKLSKNPSTQKYELRIKAYTEWEFPHAIDSTEQGIVRSDSKWFLYDDYYAYGQVFLNSHNKFKLLEPYGHTVKFFTSSNVLIYNNKYTLVLDGEIELPESIQSLNGNRIAIPFSEENQFYYLTSSSLNMQDKIKLVNNTELLLDPTDVIIDLSESQSPQRFSSQPSWKGVYFKRFNLLLNGNIDESGQLSMDETKIYTYNLNSNPEVKAWSTGEGLEFYLEEDLQNDNSFFNTFPSKLKEIKLDIDQSFLNEGYLKGTMIIPIINETEEYDFTVPIIHEGCNIGYLEDDFTDFSYILNPEGGDQQVDITIRTMGFTDNERLEMTIDIGWPALEVSMDAIDGFSIWGNYAVGFFSPNQGRNLVANASGILDQYEVTLESVGCGSSEGAYGFGASGVVVVSDDIAGENGPPKINLYSVYPSDFAPFVDEGDFDFDSISIAATIDNLNDQIADIEALNDTFEDLENAGGTVENEVNNTLNSTDLNPSGYAYSSDDFVYEEELDPEDNAEEFSMDGLTQMIEAFSVFLPPEDQVKLQEIVNFLEVLPYEELVQLYNELKDIKSLSKKLAKAFVHNQIQNINNKINEQFARVTNAVNSKIDTALYITNNFTNGVIDTIFHAIETKIIQLTQNEQFDVTPIVSSVFNVTSNALKSTINDALLSSVNENVKTPFNNFINHQIRDSITNFISEEVGGVAYQLIDDGEPDLNLNFDDLLNGIGNSIINAADPEKLLNTVKNLAKDFISDITFENYIDQLLSEVMDELLSANTAIGLALNNLLEDNLLLQNLTANIDFDFDNIGEKLANGEIDQIIKFDLTHIKINTKTVELEGFAEYKKDDPVWGNSFHLDVTAILKPKPETEIGGFVSFIAGKTTQYADNFGFWYVGAGITDILVPLTPTPFAMTGIDGAFFRHMSEQSGEFLPDIETNFGINVNMYLEDISTQGQIIELIVGAEFIFYDESFEIEINGDIKVGNKNSFSLVTGGGYLNFSSATGFLMGQFNVMANTAPILCTQGEMGIEICGADNWNVYIGKRASPVFIKLLCSDNASFESWFDISNTMLDLGIKGNFALEGRSGWFKLWSGAAKEWSVFAGVGFAFEVSTIVWWDPFGINDALIEVSAWAELGADWRKDNGDTGTWTLVAVSLYGMCHFATVPDAYVEGQLSGHVTILNVGIGFDLQMEHEFS